MFKKIKKYGEMTINKSYRENLRQNPVLRNLFWETTLSCNAKCKHCGSSAENKTYEGELTTDEIKKVLKDVADKYDARGIMLNITGGEPLIRKDLFEVMKYAKSLGFNWGMTTNGMLMNKEMIEKIKDAEMSTISVSIDGLEDTHDDFRGVPGSYKLIMKNMQLLKEARFLKVAQITTVVNKKNIHQLEQLYKIMVEELEIDSWRVVNIDPIGRANDNQDLFLDKEDYKYLFNFIKEKRKEKKIDVTYGCSHFTGINYEGDLRRQYFMCLTGLETASILYNGDIFVCPNVERRKEFIQGNVRKDNFVDVWENRYEIFRDKNRTKSDKCKNCENWDFCLGDSFHSFDFDRKEPKLCLKDI